MALAARGLRKTFAVRNVSLSVADGETLVVLGPNGAGKTTLLRAIAGLEHLDAGTIEIDGLDVTHEPPQKRRTAMVFQDNALFPHLTIEQNLAFGLRSRGATASAVRQRVRDAAETFEIAAYLKRRPSALSGGERQRAEFARALLTDPRVLLLDEPLAHLDPELRTSVRSVVLRRTRDDVAVVYVTHDHVDAMSAGDRLAIMIDGEIVQCDRPQTVYDFPANTRVARFLGSPPMNLLSNGMETIGIRPEHVVMFHAGPASADGLRGKVIRTESIGADSLVRAQTERGEVIARAALAHSPQIGDEVMLTFPDTFLRRYNRDGKLIV